MIGTRRESIAVMSRSPFRARAGIASEVCFEPENLPEMVCDTFFESEVIERAFSSGGAFSLRLRVASDYGKFPESLIAEHSLQYFKEDSTNA